MEKSVEKAVEFLNKEIEKFRRMENEFNRNIKNFGKDYLYEGVVDELKTIRFVMERLVTKDDILMFISMRSHAYRNSNIRIWKDEIFPEICYILNIG